MNDASKQGTEEFKSRWVVPTEESRAELAEWGLRTREEQDKFYQATAESLENLHRAELEMEPQDRAEPQGCGGNFRQGCRLTVEACIGQIL